MSTPAQTLFANYMSIGPSAIVTNPVSAILTLLGSDIATVYALIPAALAGHPSDITAVQLALTNLAAASAAMLAHTNRLSGISGATQVGQPTLNGVIGFAGALDNYTSGYFGTSVELLPTMFTSLGAGLILTAIDAYITALVAGLIALTILPAAAELAIGNYTAALSEYVASDSLAYTTIATEVAKASWFLSFAAQTNTTNVSAFSFLQNVMSASNIAILQTVSVLP